MMDVSLNDDLSEMRLELPTGGKLRIQAEDLRAACKCASCVRARFDSVFPSSFPDIRIVEVKPIGHYAVNIHFSDGHARGIYPWVVLREIGTERNQP